MNKNHIACFMKNDFMINYNKRISQINSNRFLQGVMKLIVSPGCKKVYLMEDIDGFHNLLADNDYSVCCNPETLNSPNDYFGLGRVWYKDCVCCKEAITTEDGWLKYLKKDERYV